ncbi:MAG TPA: LysM domain-containing protein, partial [Anaeromyxobacteraceae bacterium]|nr:LysM domain-containing protein [Anaeromyxobacteraceae bacterium]
AADAASSGEAPPADEPAGVDLSRAAETLEGTAAPRAGEAAAAASAPGGAPSTEQYTVKPGDTLWDLSGRFLNNPWYWPKVWSYNPEISNPHYIYPGNQLRFYPGAEEGPGRVEPLGPVAGAAPVEGDFEPPRELDDLSRADMKKPQEIGEADDVAVVGPYKVGYVAPRGLNARRDSFVTRGELEQSGSITAAFEDKLFLTIHDRAYARFAKAGTVKAGETYVLYKTDHPVKHPKTGELFGYKSTIIGSARVVATDDKAVTIQITQAFDPIERGTLVAPWHEKILKQVQRRPNARGIDGFIIAAQQDLVSEIGEHHVVFVDKGRQDGVEEGNVFSVIRSGDPYGREMRDIHLDPNLPREDVGSLLVIDAQATSSAALVVKSLRELYVGDKVVMKASAPATAGSGGN